MDRIIIILCILAVIDILLPEPPVEPTFLPWWRFLPGSNLVLWLLYLTQKKDD
jgi:hypothetical protein